MIDIKKEMEKRVDHPVPYLVDLVGRLVKERDAYRECAINRYHPNCNPKTRQSCIDKEAEKLLDKNTVWVDQISQPCQCVRENDLWHTDKCVHHHEKD